MMELFLIAQIAGRGVAIATSQIDSVVDIAETVAVPRTARAIRGLVALRSRVVTVIDTSVSLGFAPMAETRRAVIACVQGHHYGLLIEALDDVYALEPQPLSSGLAFHGSWGACATGIVEREGEPLLVLDLDRLIPAMSPLLA